MVDVMMISVALFTSDRFADRCPSLGQQRGQILQMSHQLRIADKIMRPGPAMSKAPGAHLKGKNLTESGKEREKRLWGPAAHACSESMGKKKAFDG